MCCFGRPPLEGIQPVASPPLELMQGVVAAPLAVVLLVVLGLPMAVGSRVRVVAALVAA